MLHEGMNRSDSWIMTMKNLLVRVGDSHSSYLEGDMRADYIPRAGTSSSWDPGWCACCSGERGGNKEL